MKFNTVKMEDVLDALIDYRGKTPHKSDKGIMTLSAKSVKNNYIDYSQCYHISEDEYSRFMVRGFPQKGDILLTTEAPLGMVARLDRDDVAIAQRLLTLRGKKNVLDNDYLLYYLQSPIGQASLKARETGTTVTGIKQAEFRKIELKIPDYEFQKKISGTLRAIDEKIKINNEINNNLFQQLFASFDHLLEEPPAEEMALGTLCSFQEGYVNPAQTHPEFFDGDIKWLRAVDINETFIINTSRTLTQAGFQSAGKSAYLFPPNTIALSKSGTIGRLGIVGDYMCGNRAVINIAPNNPQHLPFIFAYLKSRQAEYPDLAVGSVQKNLYVSLLEPLIVPVPNSSALDWFCNFGNTLIESIRNNCNEAGELISLRDTLLPKLMSGELDVSAINL